MEQLAELFKALGDSTRLRIMYLLQHGELCICDLMAGLDLPQSTISRHMAFLKRTGWVNGRRSAKWVYYTLANPQHVVQERVRHALMTSALEASDLWPELQCDAARLSAHLKTKNAATCGE